MNGKWTAGLLAIPFVAAVTLSACSDQEFAKLDQDQDGKVSESEAAAKPEVAKEFDVLDANSDGNLERAEFARFETMEPSAEQQPSQQQQTQQQQPTQQQQEQATEPGSATSQ
ncbi:hypothetical protein [Arhodomonas sp. AD133]|uniref:hypothetical protein n=1 Tax=Arhodomonas sp. AD133 TaxID=3415009 RepID=UPI003EB8F864